MEKMEEHEQALREKREGEKREREGPPGRGRDDQDLH